MVWTACQKYHPWALYSPVAQMKVGTCFGDYEAITIVKLKPITNQRLMLSNCGISVSKLRKAPYLPEILER